MADRALDPHTVAAIKESFYSLLDQNKPDKSYVMEKSTYDSFIAALSNSPGAPAISPKRKFSNRKRFKVLYKDDVPYLGRANSNKRVYHREEIFDVIFEAHCSCNHGDGKRTYAIVKESVDNIFLWECLLVTKLCFCKRTKDRLSKSRKTSSPQTKAGEIQLINMESIPDKGFRWLLLYRDDATKFLFSRPLKSRDCDEIAFELLYLFLNHGAPLFFNTSLSRNFTLKLLKNLYTLWPECPTVFGQQLQSDNHPEFLKNLEKWMKESKSTSWTVGSAFVTSALNSQESTTLGCTPYILMHRTTLEHYKMTDDSSECDKESSECYKESSECDKDKETSHITELVLFGGDDDILNEQNMDQPSDVREMERNVQDTERQPSDDPEMETPVKSLPNRWNLATSMSFKSAMEYPISEVEIDDDDATMIAYLNSLKIVQNAAGGDCLFYVVRQHIKAFNCFEFRVDTLRRRVAEYLLTNELGKEFLNEFHPDIYPHDLESNRAKEESWGGPESWLALSQIFNIQISVVAYLPPARPFLSKYWPASDAPPPRATLPVPISNRLVARYEKDHCTLLLPKDLEYPPKRFKRERG